MLLFSFKPMKVVFCAIHYGVSTAEFFAELAQAFLFDKDGPGPKEKLAAYYHGIVNAGKKNEL